MWPYTLHLPNQTSEPCSQPTLTTSPSPSCTGHLEPPVSSGPPSDSPVEVVILRTHPSSKRRNDSIKVTEDASVRRLLDYGLIKDNNDTNLLWYHFRKYWSQKLAAKLGGNDVLRLQDHARHRSSSFAPLRTQVVACHCAPGVIMTLFRSRTPIIISLELGKRVWRHIVHETNLVMLRLRYVEQLCTFNPWWLCILCSHLQNWSWAETTDVRTCRDD